MKNIFAIILLFASISIFGQGGFEESTTVVGSERVLTYDLAGGNKYLLLTNVMEDLSMSGAANHLQDNNPATIPFTLVDPATPATPVEGDQTLQVYSDGYVLSTYTGAAWDNRSLKEAERATSYYQNNTGSNIPAIPVDPLTPPTLEAGDLTIQEYDNGVVVSVYDGFSWTNTPIVDDVATTMAADVGTGLVTYTNEIGTLYQFQPSQVDQITNAWVGSPTTAGKTIASDPATGELFYEDAAGNWAAVPVATNTADYYQDNTGADIPALLVDPITPGVPTAGDQTVQHYDNGVVLSTYSGGAWQNVAIPTTDAGATHQDNTGADVPVILVDPTVIPAPVTGDLVLQEYDNGDVLSIYDGTNWINTLQDGPDGASFYQDNTGADIPLITADPTTPVVPKTGDYVLQQYDNGVVHSVYDGIAWVNIPAEFVDGSTVRQDNTATAVPAVLVDPTAIAVPIEGDAVLQAHMDGYVLSIYDGAAWTNDFIPNQDAANHHQDNTAIAFPATLVDPTTPAIPVEGDQTMQFYSNGVVSSTYTAGAWDNQLVSTNHVDGTILWVSPDGDNLTALKGDQHRPWADPWTARDAAVAGDLIFVLSGTYLESANPTGNPNLFVADISYHLNRGVILQNDTGGTVVGINAGAGGDFSISGNGQLIDYRWFTDSGDSDYNIELDLFHYEGAASNGSHGIISAVATGFNNSFVSVRIKKVNIVNTVPFDGFRIRANNSNIVWKVDNYSHTRDVASPMYSGFMIDTSVDSNWDIEFGTMESSSPLAGHDLTTAANAGGAFSLYRFDKSNTSIKFRAGVIKNYSTDGYVGTTFPANNVTTDLGGALIVIGSKTYNPTHTNCTFDIEIGIAETYMNIVRFAENVASSGNKGTITIGEAISTHEEAIQVFRYGSTDNDYTISGNFYSELQPAVNVYAGYNDQLTLKGRYETELAGAAAATLASPITFDNARLINDETVAPIISTTALNIPIIDVYSNSLIVDPNTTELISPITRDNNVK